jgi:hypothetical protein
MMKQNKQNKYSNFGCRVLSQYPTTKLTNVTHNRLNTQDVKQSSMLLWQPAVFAVKTAVAFGKTRNRLKI